jgi:hypothetical protein
MQRCHGLKGTGKDRQCTLTGEVPEGHFFYCHHHKDQKENIQTATFPFSFHGSNYESIVKNVYIRIFHGKSLRIEVRGLY